MRPLYITLMIALSFNASADRECDLRPTTIVFNSERLTLRGEYLFNNFFGLSGPVGDPNPLGGCDKIVRTIGVQGSQHSAAYIEQTFQSSNPIVDTIKVRAVQNFNALFSPAGSSISFHSLGFKAAGVSQRELRFDASASTTPGNVLITAVWVDFGINSQSVVAVFDLLPSDDAQINTYISNQSIMIQTNDGTNGIIVSTAQNKATYSRFGSLNEQGMQVGASLTFSSYAECPNSRKGESCFQ